jgi:hypothetical protein
MNIKRFACYVSTDTGAAVFRYPFEDDRFFAYRGGSAKKADIILQVKPDTADMDMSANGLGGFIKKYWEDVDRFNGCNGTGKDLIFENDDYAIWGVLLNRLSL